MRKENVLVVALVVIVLGGIYGFNFLGPNRSSTKAIATEPSQPRISDPAPSQTAADQTPAQPVSGAAIDWKDYTPGMALAGKENKNIFLYFHAPWCTYCTKLKQTTFKDKKVLAYLNENFISIQVNTDIHKELADKWQVKGLPTMWFVEPDGSRINRMPGYVDAPQLLQILKYVHTQSYTTMEFSEFVKNG
jgi:thioredoxin-related protein